MIVELVDEQINIIAKAEAICLYEVSVREIKDAKAAIKRGFNYRKADLVDYKALKKAAKVLVKYYATPDEYIQWLDTL